MSKYKIKNPFYAHGKRKSIIVRSKVPDFDNVPYCESPALGMGAPECSEDCCDYGRCHKQAYFDFIEKKHPHAELLHLCQDCGILLTPEQEGKICETANGITYFLCKKCYKTKNDSLVANQPDKFIIEDREYSKEEVLEILKKHKEDEDKKYSTCDKCGIKYLNNKKFNMIYENLENDTDLKPGTAIGSQGTPIITGVQITSTCGTGKKIKLCDNCIEKLINWLGEIKHG